MEGSLKNGSLKTINININFLRSILLKLHQKFKECRKLCNEQNETREQAEKQKNQKLYSADSILYNFAMKTCEETACADTSGELEQKELKEKYLIARTLLKVSHFLVRLSSAINPALGRHH